MHKLPELKPCPFCGKSGAQVVPGGGYHKVKCPCGITVSGYTTARQAIEVWNQRPDDPVARSLFGVSAGLTDTDEFDDIGG